MNAPILTSFTIDLAKFAMSADAMDFFMENDAYDCLGSVEGCEYAGSVMTLSFELDYVPTAEKLVELQAAFESETAQMVADATADAEDDHAAFTEDYNS